MGPDYPDEREPMAAVREWRRAGMAWGVGLLLLAGCGAQEGAPKDPGRVRYEADRAHCDSVSAIEAARRSCMTYRGWPDGKYRR